MPLRHAIIFDYDDVSSFDAMMLMILLSMLFHYYYYFRRHAMIIFHFLHDYFSLMPAFRYAVFIISMLFSLILFFAILLRDDTLTFRHLLLLMIADAYDAAFIIFDDVA
jgi:hypothetical protein